MRDGILERIHAALAHGALATAQLDIYPKVGNEIGEYRCVDAGTAARSGEFSGIALARDRRGDRERRRNEVSSDNGAAGPFSPNTSPGPLRTRARSFGLPKCAIIPSFSSFFCTCAPRRVPPRALKRHYARLSRILAGDRKKHTKKIGGIKEMKKGHGAAYNAALAAASRLV